MSYKRKSEDRDFTGGAIHTYYQKKGSTGRPEFDERVGQLVKDWGGKSNPQLVEELIISALRLAEQEVGVGDLKLINRSLKEMGEAFAVFRPFRFQRKVVVFGSARTALDKPEYKAAVEFGEKMVEKDFMMITGAGDGIMGAAQRGAGRENGFGLNIRLPFEQGANETIQGDDKLVEFNYFFTRKLTFVKEAEAVALFPGGFGTMDEGFELLTLIQTGKASVIPIVMVDAPGGSYWKTWLQFAKEHLLRLGMISESDFSLFKVFDDVDESIAEILQFYKVFHSYRYVGQRMVIRLNDRLSDYAIERLNDDFADLLSDGRYEQGSALEAEKNEPQIVDLPRLIFSPNQRNTGRLRELIDAINISRLAE